MTRSARWLLAMLAAAVAVIAVSTAVAVLAGGESAFPTDTPEGAVQAYLRAVAERDAEAAIAMLSPALQERCDHSLTRQSIRTGRRDFSAVLLDVRRDGVIDVSVEITERYEGDGWSIFEEVFTVDRFDGEWRIAEPAWPAWCPVAPSR